MGNWSFNLGLRGDIYNGLVTANQAEPRLGVAYNIKREQHCASRFLCAYFGESFNENLVLASEGCNTL